MAVSPHRSGMKPRGSGTAGAASTARWSRIYGGPRRFPWGTPWGKRVWTWTGPNPPGGSEGIRFGEARHPAPPQGLIGQRGVNSAGPRPCRRRDLPHIRQASSSHGSLPDLRTPALKTKALAAFKSDMLATPTRETLKRICVIWGLGDPLRLIVTIVLAVGATLKAGLDKSHETFLGSSRRPNALTPLTNPRR